MRGEIGDQEATAGGKQAGRFGQSGFWRGNEMQNLMEDDGVGRTIGKRQCGDVTLAQFPPVASVEFGAGEAKHFRAAVNAYGMVGGGAE